MFEVLKNAWKIADLRKKIVYTFMIIAIFRIGSAIPVPFLDPANLTGMLSGTGTFFDYINVLSGGSFSQATLFALGIQPYITSSIIMQLLTIAFPSLERMMREGEEGKKKHAKITRMVTGALAVMLAVAYYFVLRNSGAVNYTTGTSGIIAAAAIILAFAAGACIVMWLGDQISEKGVGNGISIILFAGIVSSAPSAVASLWAYFTLGLEGQIQYLILVPLVVVIFALVIYFIVVMTSGERRIPVQYAKKVVGRKMYGGNSSFIPIKVTMSGVLPIIFAGAILSIPSTINTFFNANGTIGWMNSLFGIFNYTSWFYAILYFFLIIAFSYFYVTVQYNPVEIANNLRKNNGAIAGIRPGKPTSDFVARIISKITLIGGIFLGFIAVMPIFFSTFSGMNIAIGGTTVLIVVGVALETSKTLESQMMMRHYKGFLE